MPADSSASNPACSQQASRRLARWLARPVELPEGDAGRPAGVRDHPWLGDLGEDESSPAHHVVVPDRPGEFLFVLDPVLQRHHRRARTHQRPQPGRSGVGVEGLDAEQHHLARADLSRVIGGRRQHLEGSVTGMKQMPTGAFSPAQRLSQSAPFTHFGSKEDLQLTAIEEARQRYVQEVIAPALAVGSGITGLYAPCEALLSDMDREVFPGRGAFCLGHGRVRWPVARAGPRPHRRLPAVVEEHT
jgi:hypothetical protein